MAELQLNTKLKSVQNDWGVNFNPFVNAFSEQGIVYGVIYPHTHHQNGSVKQTHRHTSETGLALLAQAKLPFQFWNHAPLIPATFLINRLPTPVLNFQSPIYILYNQELDYQLKVFGCACFPFLNLIILTNCLFTVKNAPL